MSIATDILNAKILVVDDSEVNVKLLEYMLEAAGYTGVSSTTDSREVEGLYKTNAYDLILLDLNMPNMDGFQVMAALDPIEKNGYLPILVVTAEPDHKLRALQAGAKDFVSKPIDQTEVLTRVHNMLEIRLLHKNLRSYNENLQGQVRARTFDLRAAQEKVGYLSNFDSLTGLPNRILLRDRVKRAQVQVAGDENVMGFFVVGLARLSLIRGSLGMKAEELLLMEAAKRLKEWAVAEDTIARFGDESFALVAVRSSPGELAAVAAQIITLMDLPFVLAGQELHVEACIGISTFPNDGDDFDFLVQAAEASMRRASGSKTERYRFYTPELSKGANERLKLENSLRRALERDELILHYQPQLDLTSGKVIGMEALIRWQHPELGLIPPGRFIGIAEETGLILPIGEWVIFQACRQNKLWQNAGLPKIPVAVNLSAKQFSSNITNQVQAALSETKLDPKYLELELTESLSMEDPENTIAILRKLKEMGVCLSIDDFGTGYSNLNYLKRFPVTKLKLDQSFVRDLISDPDDLAISRAVIAMGHSLRLKVIAEGVETEGQLALLMANGCDEMQGYLFSRPIDAAACASLLHERKSLIMGRLKPASDERVALVIDDDADFCASMRRLADEQGYKLMQTGTVAEAFEILAATRVGVVLCSQRMQQMNGIEFLARVKQIHPDVVRMVASGHTDLQSVTDAVNRGAIFRFLPKPSEDAVLVTALSDAFIEYESHLVAG